MMNEAQTINDLLEAIALPDAAVVDRLHARLVDDAERDEVLDVCYRTVDSPYGPLLLAATTQGLVRVAFALEGHDAVLAKLAASISPRILRGPRRLDRAAMQWCTAQEAQDLRVVHLHAAGPLHQRLDDHRRNLVPVRVQ